MSAEQYKTMLRRLYDEVMNAGNLAIADEVVAADAIEHEAPPGTPAEGPEVVKQWVGMMRTAFPDFHLEVDDMIVEGDRVAARVTMSGTHQGDFMGIPPTGKRFSISAIDIVRFAEGKMVEHWGATDNLGLLQQLGAVPGPGQGGS
jgi:steroid delta-isomerase-like uncharacterized protein